MVQFYSMEHKMDASHVDNLMLSAGEFLGELTGDMDEYKMR